MPFRATFDCLWCGTAHTCRSPDDLDLPDVPTQILEALKPVPVTKPLSAYAALVAIEEGAVELDEPAGPEGSTVRHLLAHTSGLAFDEHQPWATIPRAARTLVERVQQPVHFEVGELADVAERPRELRFAPLHSGEPPHELDPEPAPHRS